MAAAAISLNRTGGLSKSNPMPSVRKFTFQNILTKLIISNRKIKT